MEAERCLARDRGGSNAIASMGAPAAAVDFITDAYLLRAVWACCNDNGLLLLPRDVRDLIERYAPKHRPTANEIPQEKRQEFLEDLSVITDRPLPSPEPLSVDSIVIPPCTPAAGQTILTDPDLTSGDAQLIANGYEPIAVKGKVPVGRGWNWNTRRNSTEAIAAERATHQSAASTGLRTGRLVGIDIDIVPPRHVQAIKELANRVLGGTSLERVGAKGAMLCYRNEIPIGKITVSGTHPNKPGKVEILGLGQQFVSYGIHPDTGKPYTWTNALRGGEPCRRL